MLPFTRLFAQLAIIYSNAILRATVQVYTDACQRGAIQNIVPKVLQKRRMGITEAAKVLDVDFNKVSIPDIENRFARLFEINKTSENFHGSPYIQKRVQVAKTILKENILSRNQIVHDNVSTSSKEQRKFCTATICKKY